MAIDPSELLRQFIEQTSQVLSASQTETETINTTVEQTTDETSSTSDMASDVAQPYTTEVAMAATYNADDFGGIPEPQCWADVRDCFNAGVDKILLYGAPGIGKTYAGLFYGDVSRGAERLICTEDMTTADVGGCMLPTAEGGFAWHDGSALRAWKNGSRLIVDEIDKAGSDVFAQLLAFTDTVDSASFTVPSTGEIFRPQPGFSVVMTSNIEHPDELPAALKDRFSCAIHINAPHPAALMRYPENQRMLAAALVSGKPGQRVSLRQLQFFNQLLASNAFDMQRAARLAFSAHMADQIIQSLQIGTLSVDASL